MKKFAFAVFLLAAMWGGKVQATEFLMLDLDTDSDPDDPSVTLLDPNTLMAGEPGHKLATFAVIHDDTDWHERKMELDCTAERWRQLGGVFHEPDGSVNPDTADNGWTDLETGSVGAYMHDMVCDWPDKRPSADEILEGPDLQTMITRASSVLDSIEDENDKKKDEKK